LNSVQRLGWTVHLTELKKEHGHYVASTEDMLLLDTVSAVCAPGKLQPIGANPARLSVTDLFIVTADKDHLVTLNTTNLITVPELLRWCVVVGEKNIDALEKWGAQYDRLLKPLNRELLHGGAPRSSLEQPESEEDGAPCDKFDSCESFSCRFAHSSARPAKCAEASVCQDPFCPYLHPVVRVGLQSRQVHRLNVPANCVLNTVGKSDAITQGLVRYPCTHFDQGRGRCRFMSKCTFLHIDLCSPDQDSDLVRQLAEE
jgi:hypothetical protein